MLSKEEYVIIQIKNYIYLKIGDEESIIPYVLNELIEQWEFDYDMGSELRPHILERGVL